MREAYIEKKAKEFAESNGWKCYKFKSTINGVPDRVFMRSDKGTWFVEFKKFDEELSEQQTKRHAEMKAHGANIIVFDDLSVAKAFLK